MDRGHSMDGNEVPSTNFAVANKDEGDDISAAAARHVTAANMTAASNSKQPPPGRSMPVPAKAYDPVNRTKEDSGVVTKAKVSFLVEKDKLICNRIFGKFGVNLHKCKSQCQARHELS